MGLRGSSPLSHIQECMCIGKLHLRTVVLHWKNAVLEVSVTVVWSWSEKGIGSEKDEKKEFTCLQNLYC